MKTSSFRPKPHRSATLPTAQVSRPRPPARANTLPTSPVATRPAATPRPTTTPAATTPAALSQGGTVKHPGMPSGAPSYSPYSKTTGESDNLGVSGGDNKLTAPPTATQNTLIDKPGRPFQKDAFGGTVSGNVGSIQASTTHQNGGGVFHHSAQAEINGPSASYAWQKAHAGRMGVSSTQLTADATAFKATGQAGISADYKNHAYTAALTGKVESGVGVTASANHDFNRHVGGYVKGEGRASATAFVDASAQLDPRTATAMLSAQAGAAATAGAYGTVGGHVGRLHGSATAGAVAGVAAQAGGKIGLENGFLKQSADVNAAMGVGTHFKTDVAVDLRHHMKPGIASGLRPGLAAAAGVGAPVGAVQPEKSAAERFFSNIFGG